MRDGLEFDRIDAHYFYPDGAAAVRMAQDFGKPVTVTARCTDLNLIPQYPAPRQKIVWAANQASGIITVCQALRDELIKLNVAADKVRVLRNGVDLQMFQPIDRDKARAALELTGSTLLSVGHLIERKGHNLVVSSLCHLPDTSLVISGDGPEREALEALAVSDGVSDRVNFLGRVDHAALRDIYGAVDALVVAPSREGWANVLLEAMACGTPVVANNVWGTLELVATPEVEVLMADRTPRDLADTIEALFAALPDRADTRRYAERFSWDDTTRGQEELFRSRTARS